MEVNRARKQCPDSAGPSAGQGSDTARGRVAGNSGPGRTGSAKMGLGHHAPPFKGRGHLADVGIGGEVSDFSQEAVKVVLFDLTFKSNESALESQGAPATARSFPPGSGCL